MKYSNILDDQLVEQFQEYLFEKEEILWTGYPKPKFTITLLDMGGYYDVASGPSSILGFIFAAMCAGVYYFYSSQNFIGCAITIVLGLLLILLPDILKNERKKNTKYALTKNKAYFQLWKWGKKSIHIIDLKDVAKTSIEAYPDKSGTLHFLPKKPFGFFTHDFALGARRHYPTFEMVPEVKALQLKIEELRKNIHHVPRKTT